jgi:hypothetical protein
VASLGHRHAGEMPAQVSDERPDDGALLFQRAHVAQQHVQGKSTYVRGFSRISKVSTVSPTRMSL